MAESEDAKEAKRLLRKLRFREWTDTIEELSSLERRLSGVLISRVNMDRGYAWPSLESIAEDLGKHPKKDKRSIQRAVHRLAALEVWDVRPGGGRGHATEYRPRFDKVPPEGDVYQSCREEKASTSSPFETERTTPPPPFDVGAEDAEKATAPLERVTATPERVTAPSVKGDGHVTPTVQVTGQSTEQENRSSAEAPFPGDEVLEEETHSAAPNSGGQAVFEEWKARKREFGEHLARVERRLKEEDLPGADLRSINESLDHILGELDRGDALYQQASRLQNDVEFKLAFAP